MSFLKIRSYNSNDYLMILNKNNYRFSQIRKIFDFNEFLKKIDSNINFSIEGDSLNILKIHAEKAIEDILSNKEYLHKNEGREIIFKKKKIFINVKKDKMDRDITSVYSLLKAIIFCLKNNELLDISHVDSV